jgi:aminopeptidase N
MKILLQGLLFLGLLSACGSSRPTTTGGSESRPGNASPIAYEQLDTLVVTPDGPGEDEKEAASLFDPVGYRSSETQKHDLLHTRLELAFDWEKEEVAGKATLRLKPFFYSASDLVLDAKGFIFHRVSLAGRQDTLAYTYDGNKLTISLDREYTREEEYVVFIDYTARPSASGGSAAITSDKGLFFINPRGEEPGKPRQIWTQGETEHNSRWFPTIDKPNERCTQEMLVMVDTSMVTLSNGLLVSSTLLPGGKRTDYWRQDIPHAPYLFMLAVGDFAVVKDSWRGIQLGYYVEPAYENDAKAIFPYTPDMLSFFSDILGVPYPWQKYSQIVVRDYVSGAMENTTAAIFGDFIQRHERELVDVLTNEKIVAHEMMHHWFGDYVTCESWSNLALNEGFANYSEYLWLEHKYGRDAASYHLLEEWAGYFSQARNTTHPLIDFTYDDKEDMFDAHSYNKGGAVLHMLRNYVGDAAFFASLKLYLTRNALSAVEVHDLRLAFEDVTGEDLNWFFNQWFLSDGHPKLDVSYDYDSQRKEIIVSVEQSQTGSNIPAVFWLPVAVDVYMPDGLRERHKVWVKEREQVLRLPAPVKPALVIFDADHVLLAERADEKEAAEYIFQFKNAPHLFERIEAISVIDFYPELTELLPLALRDTFYAIRQAGLSYLSEDLQNPDLVEPVRNMAKMDPHSEVRSMAIEKLAEWKDEEAVRIAVEAMETARPYSVISAALQAVAELDPKAGIAAAQKLEGENSEDIILSIGSIYADGDDMNRLAFFAAKLEEVDGYGALSFYVDYQRLLVKGSMDEMKGGAEKLAAIAKNMKQSPWRRISAGKAIVDMQAACTDMALASANAAKAAVLRETASWLRNLFNEIKSAETDEQVLELYKQF